MIGFDNQEGDANHLKKTPELFQALQLLVEEETAGNPMGGRKWTHHSLRYMSKTLQTQGIKLSHETIRQWLKHQGYSLKSNRKSFEASVPQRDAQFRYIRRVKRLFIRAGYPVISVDAKKKELVGNFKNPGLRWQRRATVVNTHDFPKDATAKVVPYGIYDVVHNLGYVYVGIAAATPEFAVDAIVYWWQRLDRPVFPQQTKLLILCDAGGNNGYRLRNWKRQLQTALVDRFGIEVMVCHYPTGTSKWNPVEHRLFSFISKNWAGYPLRSLPILLAVIRGTTTTKGLKVKARLLKKKYRKQVKVSDREMATLNIEHRPFCPHWNYIIKPRTLPPNKA
jgi:Rhodopirellula transposase DDE domain